MLYKILGCISLALVGTGFGLVIVAAFSDIDRPISDEKQKLLAKIGVLCLVVGLLVGIVFLAYS